MDIVITGGCGFLGQHLTKLLLGELPTCRITLLDLNEPNPKSYYAFTNEKRVKYLTGKNICDVGSIEHAFDNVDVVFHLAGVVAFSVKDKKKLYAVNINGTKNVYTLSVKSGVKRFIHVSSVAALGYNDKKNDPISEDFTFDWEVANKYKKYYMISKHEADLFLLKQKDQCNLNIVYPGLMLGPGDQTNSVKLLNAMKKKQIPFNTPGGTNVIDVRDVARGLVKVLQNGDPGERYLLSGYNMTFKEQNKIIASVLGVENPKMTLPKYLSPVLRVIILMYEKLSKKPLVTADNIHSSFLYRYFDNAKAASKLNWSPKINFTDTIKDTNTWMKEKDLI